MKTEAANFSETLLPFYKTSRLKIPVVFTPKNCEIMTVKTIIRYLDNGQSELVNSRRYEGKGGSSFMHGSILKSGNSPRYPLYCGLAGFLFWAQCFVGDKNHTTIFHLPACNTIAISTTLYWLL